MITPQNARPMRYEVRLNDNGTLNAIARGMVPETGPFRCHLEALARGASQATVISDIAEMR